MRHWFRLFCIGLLLLSIYHTGWTMYHADAAENPALVLNVKPSLPKVPQRPKPRVPQMRVEIALQTSKTPASPAVVPIKSDPEKRLLASVNAAVSKPLISAADIERGWYQAAHNEKKLGTPPNWRFTQSPNGPLWANPEAIAFFERREKEALCRSTGGSFLLSCLETETAACKPIEKSACECPEYTAWQDGSGCLQTSEAGDLVSIDPADLSRGWYEGLMTEKKQGTPSHWIWNPLSDPPRWQNNLSR